jgi:hypothetical protein
MQQQAMNISNLMCPHNLILHTGDDVDCSANSNRRPGAGDTLITST